MCYGLETVDRIASRQQTLLHYAAGAVRIHQMASLIVQ